MLSLAKASKTLDAPIKFDKPAENVAISIPAKIYNGLIEIGRKVRSKGYNSNVPHTFNINKEYIETKGSTLWYT